MNNIFYKLYKYVTDVRYRFIVNACRGFYDSMPDKEFLIKCFESKMGYQLDLNNPITFNEKLQWLKLYDHNANYIKMVDKYEAKKYVAGLIGEKYIIPTINVWDKVEEIDFASLPDKFVLKNTHDSGSIVLCTDKRRLNTNYVYNVLNKSFVRSYYLRWREWPYKNVKPRIIAEEYIENDSIEGLHDYKVWCFDGRAHYVQYITGRKSDKTYEGFYDRLWNLQNFSYHNPLMKEPVSKPACLNQLLELAEIIAKDIPFGRIDFYILPGNIIKFGEITFYPAAGMDFWHPKEMDLYFGKLIKLPRRANGNCK